MQFIFCILISFEMYSVTKIPISLPKIIRYLNPPPSFSPEISAIPITRPDWVCGGTCPHALPSGYATAIRCLSV